MNRMGLLCVGFVISILLWDIQCANVPKLKYSGMTFTGDKYCPNVTFASESAKTSLYHLYTTGANSVCIVVTQYQDNSDSTTIYPLYSPVYSSYYTYVTATDNEIIASIKNAQQLNMTVMLKLQVDLTKGSGWRGDISFSSEQAWDAWFKSYTTALLHYAKLAQDNKVGIFSISCELQGTSGQDARWRKVIASVRSVYKGLLTDAANYGGEEVGKSWWDAVDIIGVDAYYFGANGNSDMTYDQIVSAWKEIVPRLENLSKKFKLPLIFSEVGFCPGSSCSRTVVPTQKDLELQANYYKATLDVWSPLSWFQGIFWWNWVTDAAFGGSKNPCMSPAFKPAELVLREYYRATLPQPSPPPYSATCLCTL